jgi:hypothetical protein
MTGGDRTEPIRDHDRASSFTLLGRGVTRLRARPGALLALVLAGVVVAAGDWFALHDPIPTETYEGIQHGEISVSLGILVGVASRATVPLTSFVGLKVEWLAWAVGTSVVPAAVSAVAAVVALTRLLDTSLTAGAVVRYLIVTVVFVVGAVNVDVSSLLLGLLLLVAFTVVVVRLFAFPGLLAAGESIRTAANRSWARSQGYGWQLLGVIVILGFLNHVLTSVPVAGPVGSGLIGAVHAATVAAFLEETGALGED